MVSKKSRPSIIVDLDNCVYPFVDQFLLWLSQNHIITPFQRQNLRIQYREWSFWKEIPMTTGEALRWWRLGVEDGIIYGSGRPIEGARDALWKLSDAEWDIHIATNRLNHAGVFSHVIENTSQWLRDNNIPYRSLSFTDRKYHIRAEAIIDDQKENMSKHHNQHILFPTNHNQQAHVGSLTQKLTWQEITEKLIGN